MQSVEYYVKGLFRNANGSEELSEQKEELTTHLIDRIEDLQKTGLAYEEAFEKAVSGLGNIDELIDTLTGKKIRIPFYKIVFFVMLAGFLYGIFYLGCMFKNYFFGMPVLFIGTIMTPAFLAYFFPFFYFSIRYFKFKNKSAVVDFPHIRETVFSFVGWFVISAVCIVGNVLLIRFKYSEYFWAWMPTMGVFTWPWMTVVKYVLLKLESKKTCENLF